MALNLNPSSQEQQVQEQQVQEQKSLWSTIQEDVIQYVQKAQQKDKYPWTEDEAKDMGGKPRCRFYTKDFNSQRPLRNPVFKVYFRNSIEKAKIQKAIDAVDTAHEHKVTQHISSYYVCSDEHENFSIFINAKASEEEYVFKAELIGSITGYTYQDYEAYLDEGTYMAKFAKGFLRSSRDL